jgi:hypothetical protein
MKLIFTRSNSFLSRMIRFLTGEPVSHVAFVVDDFIIHSTLFGPEIRTLQWAEAHYEVLFEKPVPESSRARILSVMTNYDSHSYDFTGLLYLGIRYAMKKYLRLSLPKANLWQVSGMLTCVEFATVAVDAHEESMLTPFGLCARLKAEPA